MQLQTNRYVMIGASLALALAIGFVMQKSGSPAQGQAQVIQPAAPVTQAALGSAAPARPEGQGPDAAPVEITEVRQTAASNGIEGADGDTLLAALSPAGEDVRPGPMDDTTGFDCPVEMSATPMAAAMVQLSVSASCAPNERVTIHHNGLMFTEVTDDTGTVEIGVPALAEQSVFISSFSNGEGGVAMAEVPDLADYHRVVLQWGGEAGLSLHAAEFGAAYGEPGHISLEQSGSLIDAVDGTGGVLTWLGAVDVPKPLVAEVYTFPAGHALASGAVDFLVELEVTADNCGTDIAAQTIETSRGETPVVRSLQLYVPDCDAEGDFLVLNDVLESLSIASN